MIAALGKIKLGKCPVAPRRFAILELRVEKKIRCSSTRREARFVRLGSGGGSERAFVAASESLLESPSLRQAIANPFRGSPNLTLSRQTVARQRWATCNPREQSRSLHARLDWLSQSNLLVGMTGVDCWAWADCWAKIGSRHQSFIALAACAFDIFCVRIFIIRHGFHFLEFLPNAE